MLKYADYPRTVSCFFVCTAFVSFRLKCCGFRCSKKLDHDALNWVLHHQQVLGKMIADIRRGILDSFRTLGSVDESLETNIQSETNSPRGSLAEHCALLFDQMDECCTGLVNVEQLRDGFGMIGWFVA